MASRQAILRRSKDAERKVGRWFLEHDGPAPAPMHPGGPFVTVTGRVGHIPELQADIWTRTYLTEVKNILLTKTLLDFWNKVVDRSRENGKEPALVIVPSNRPGISPDLHIISADRHAFLLDCERRVLNG